MEKDLIEALDWTSYWKSRAEEAEEECRTLAEENEGLTNRLLASEAKLLRIYEHLIGPN